ncbi:MAG: RdgB/HAM1 family non-canonical purine NTP pyrophosphatase [Rugosibacter sp.]|nr:MAG: RdgB/HAM1 family non-canonical purine NTP pyrophosphatase [Rugosibacter sp.]TBR11347.1 MAG: RdgB/HAM1 family non-canonical purine NTP pyrophosphatase [Rugosibacter sp.]
MMQKLVLASSNSGKLREFAELLAPLNFQLVPQADFAVPEADEPHATFIENALAKARHAARLTGLPALADDSGLVVPALGGAPGVHAARYAGEPKDDQRNNQKLVAALENIADRRAHYVAVLALVRHVDDPQPLIGEGEWHGEIIATPRGKGGFGYDPHFFIPDLQRTAAELPADEKNRRSHRGQALLQLIAKLNHAA